MTDELDEVLDTTPSTPEPEGHLYLWYAGVRENREGGPWDVLVVEKDLMARFNQCRRAKGDSLFKIHAVEGPVRYNEHGPDPRGRPRKEEGDGDQRD